MSTSALSLARALVRLAGNGVTVDPDAENRTVVVALASPRDEWGHLLLTTACGNRHLHDRPATAAADW